MFRLSKRSLDNLEGVDFRLIDCVLHAIKITTVDFGVIEGVRTRERQAELVASGASRTMNSKHLTGHAVDLMAYIGSRESWELNLYDEIAEAMREAARVYDVPLRWGGAWNVHNIAGWNNTMEKAMEYYIDKSRAAGRRPFIDGPHFEIYE